MEFPIFNAVLKEEDDGIFAISLVDVPATLKPAMLFKKDNEFVQFAVQNEEKHLISGVVMLANTPIYRRDGDFEYFIQYQPETLALMAEKMLKEGYQNQVDLQHNGEYVDGVSLVELYIKDSTKGIAPNFIEGIPDGSLMGTYKCDNEEVWEKMKSGELTGFSLAGFFSLEQTNKVVKYNNQNKRKLSMSKLKEQLKKLLQEFASINTDKGEIFYEGELAVGIEIFDDNDNPLADGEYATEEKVIVVADGKVTEIREKEVVETPIENKAESFSAKCAQKFESYEDIERRIYDAIRATGIEDCWLVEAGDNYAIVSVWTEDREVFYRYDVSINGEEVTVSNPVEVVSKFVPAEEPKAEEVEAACKKKKAKFEGEEPAAEEPKVEEPAIDVNALKADVDALKAEIEALKATIAEISNEPMVEPVAEQFAAISQIESTGDSKMDNLLRIVSAKRK